ncbi:MAG: efflux RND transporter periplasmic adaptor subunit [Smithellaceae bacterium]|nr:efflux RND transporter periplasmic adaptor subunit [Smithellaceae bacterium]
MISTTALILYFLAPNYSADLLQRVRQSLPGSSIARNPGGNQGAPATLPQAGPESKEVQEAPTPELEIPTDKQQLMGVKTEEVSIRPFQKIIRTVGRIEYDERRLATINSKFEGWIEKLHVDQTGQYIKRGQPLAEIYSPELVATQQEFLGLLKWQTGAGSENPASDLNRMLSRDAEAIIEGARARLRLWDISEEQIKKIEETRKPIRTLTIFSPVNGHVVEKMAVLGMRIMPGERLFDIADLSSLWVIADIYEYELSLIRIGQAALIGLSYLPGRDFATVVDYIYPALSAQTRTAKVRFTIPNPDGRLKPQMFTNVELKIEQGKRLSIPEEAVIDTGRRQIVYVDKGEGFFEPREIERGMGVEGWREVKRGLKAGERVAKSATFLIDSEAQLKGVKPLGLEVKR